MRCLFSINRSIPVIKGKGLLSSKHFIGGTSEPPSMKKQNQQAAEQQLAIWHPPKMFLLAPLPAAIPLMVDVFVSLGV